MIARTLFALLFFAAGAHAGVVEDVQSRIEQAAVLRGEFAQVKTVAGFRTPLRSRGTFLVARERGVVWDTREPFPSVLVLGRDRIRSGTGGALEDVPLAGGAEQGMRELNAMLIALLGGELSAVQQRFDAAGALDGDARWALTLTPRDPRVARAVQSIALHGGRFVEHVVLLDPAGNRTEITFSAQRTTPAGLTDAEAKPFD